MKVIIYDRQDDLSVCKRSLQKLVEIVLFLQRKSYDQVMVYFVSTNKICKLHEQFFQDPSTTDCISFPLDPQAQISPSILGEIFVCPATAVTYSRRRKVDPYEELARYVIHGILHCLGYDDLTLPERRRMRYHERRALHMLKEKKCHLQKR